jgi:uncharacterized UBP type Zn finger protein
MNAALAMEWLLEHSDDPGIEHLIFQYPSIVDWLTD